MSGKRKRNVVEIKDKLEAIRQVESGALLRCVAAKFNVGVSTVGDWIKNKDKLLKHSSKIPNRKTMKTSDFEKVNEALFLWFTQQRVKGVPISGPVLQEKARMLAGMLGEEGENFLASKGWLDRFKNRYGIRQLSLCGEKMSADQDAVDVFKTEFEEMVEGYTMDQLFNADETGLNFKMLPKKSLACVSEISAPGHKMQKERITVLTAANASGSFRLPLMCIGKSHKPRALKNIAPNALPVYYKAQKNAWMSSELFELWFHKQFVPKVKKFLKDNDLPMKAILFVDNAPTHPRTLKDGEIKVELLPPNVTSLVQPMDQGVIETFKRHYRGVLLRHILHESANNNLTLTEALKLVTMKDVMYWCAQSWEKVKSTTLRKAWNKITDGITSIDDYEEEDFENLSALIKKVPGCEDIEEEEALQWVQADDIELELTEEEIVEMIQEPEPREADDTNNEPSVSLVKADDAFKAFEVRHCY